MRNKRSISIFILIVLIISLFIPITAIATNEDTQILKDGTYKIKAAVGSDMYLDINIVKEILNSVLSQYVCPNIVDALPQEGKIFPRINPVKKDTIMVIQATN